MTFPPVKIGVVGLGRFGRLHALTLAGLAEAELVGLVARRDLLRVRTNMVRHEREREALIRVLPRRQEYASTEA